MCSVLFIITLSLLSNTVNTYQETDSTKFKLSKFTFFAHTITGRNCTVTLLNTHYVLTSASCIQVPCVCYIDERRYEVENVITYPGFDALKQDVGSDLIYQLSSNERNIEIIALNDLALLKLERPVVESNNIEFVTIDYEDTTSHDCESGVWINVDGVVFFQPLPLRNSQFRDCTSSDLLKKQIQLNNLLCDKFIVVESWDINSLISTFINNAVPLICEGKLYGILEHYEKKTLRTFQTVYTKVEKFKEWIYSVVGYSTPHTEKSKDNRGENVVQKITELKQIINKVTVYISLRNDEICAAVMLNRTHSMSTATCLLKALPRYLHYERKWPLFKEDKKMIAHTKIHPMRMLNSTGSFYDVGYVELEEPLDDDLRSLKSEIPFLFPFQDSIRECTCLCGFPIFLNKTVREFELFQIKIPGRTKIDPEMSKALVMHVSKIMDVVLDFGFQMRKMYVENFAVILVCNWCYEGENFMNVRDDYGTGVYGLLGYTKEEDLTNDFTLWISPSLKYEGSSFLHHETKLPMNDYYGRHIETMDSLASIESLASTLFKTNLDLLEKEPSSTTDEEKLLSEFPEKLTTNDENILENEDYRPNDELPDDEFPSNDQTTDDDKNLSPQSDVLTEYQINEGDDRSTYGSEFVHSTRHRDQIRSDINERRGGKEAHSQNVIFNRSMMYERMNERATRLDSSVAIFVILESMMIMSILLIFIFSWCLACIITRHLSKRCGV